MPMFLSLSGDVLDEQPNVGSADRRSDTDH
jgi:hypothetical protein